MSTATTVPSPDAEPSVNVLADTIFANGLGANPDGLLSDADNEFDVVDELLPLRQRMSEVMMAAHESIDEKAGAVLADLSLAELQALQTQIRLREQQLLTGSEPTELFAPIRPEDHGFHKSIVPTAEVPSPQLKRSLDRLSLVEYVQIREESADLAETVSTRATADLVKYLRRPEVEIEIPGRRRRKTPLTAATAFVSSVLRLTFSAVDRRINAAATMWPEMEYRRTKLQAPRLASHLKQGRIPLATAAAAQQKLSDIRQAIRRAGGDESTADDVVALKEQEFLHHAVRNNPHTFSRYAHSHSVAVTNALIGPKKALTNQQLKHEKGIFYDGPVGDSLHKITAIVDGGELLHLNAIRELATKLDSAISMMQAQSPDDPTAAESQLSSDDDQAADDVANNPRITSADIDFGIAQLFDGQTKAERWLNAVMDFLSAGLILRKTYDPHATSEDQQRRDDALHKAAEHSEVLADILGMDQSDHDTSHAEDGEPSTQDPSQDPLSSSIPQGYELLRPTLDLIVEIPFQDLAGAFLGGSARSTNAHDDAEEITKIIDALKSQNSGLTTPIGSPGNVEINYALARQLACTGKIIPMVLGSASQPLDVGRAQRIFPRAIRRALHVRDRGCIVPGCSKPATWCEGHHIDPWKDGGSTALKNAVLLCRHHHGAVHNDLMIIHIDDNGLPSVSLPPSIDPKQTRYRNIYWRH